MTSNYSKNYIDSLRLELIDLVENTLTPLSFKYRYDEIALETNIKWKPIVLILGNYSSGKSTLINELLGMDIQATGQAPTDDAFTVITSGSDAEGSDAGRKDGAALLNDPHFPFAGLKKHGDRFKAHFCMKKVQSPILQNLAVIDTPGMLDSVSERDRGYNYQQVIGDLAQIADMVLVLFDPHKAGTVQETYYSLRETLPAKTYEDRIIFVLNRIDECGSLNDLLRVYGTLCWNLSQMTGRKDIPKILLTHSSAMKNPNNDQPFLKMLENQREELLGYIKNAPKHRLDHLASFTENHGERIAHLTEGVWEYAKARRNFYLKNWAIGGSIIGLLTIAAVYLIQVNPAWELGFQGSSLLAVLLGVLVFLGWMLVCKMMGRLYANRLMEHLDELTDLKSQSRKDTWAYVKPILLEYLRKEQNLPSLRAIKKDRLVLKHLLKKSGQEIRAAINKMSEEAHP